MTLFETARIALIDDRPEEALPIIQALGRKGIGAMFFQGDDVDQMPKEPIPGLRLLFFDMELGTGGQPAKTMVATMLSVLERIVGRVPAPVAIVVWTKHPEHYEVFKERLQEEFPALVPGAICCIAKAQYKTGDEADSWDIDKLLAVVDKALTTDSNSVMALLSWEQVSHDAATSATNELVDIAWQSSQHSRERLSSCLSLLLRGLADSSAGKTLSPENATAHLLEPLQQVHYDFVSHSNGYDPASFSWITGEKRLESEPDKARLHKYLWTAQCRTPAEWAPGSVLVDVNNDLELLASNGITKVRMIKDFGVRGTKDAAMKQCLDTLSSLEKRMLACQEAGDEQKAALTQKKITEQAGILDAKWAVYLQKCWTCLIEVSPVCDFAHDKRFFLRLLTGLLVDVSEASTKKVIVDEAIRGGSDWIRELGPFWHNNKPHYLLTSLRHPISVPMGKLPDHPTFMLRAGVLADMVSHYSSYASRPGILRID